MGRRAVFLLLIMLFISVGLIQAQPAIPLPRTAVELLTNGDFETDADTDKIPDGWNATNTSDPQSDKLKCNKVDVPVAHSGECAFMFRGNANGATTKINQNASDFTALVDGATLQFSAYLDPRSATPGETFAKAKVKLSNGNKLILKLAVPASSSRAVEDYVLVSASAPLALEGATVVKVSTQLRNRETGGKFLLDDISLTVQGEVTLVGDFLTDPVGGANEYFGYAVAVDDAFVAVGAPVTGSSTGQVFVYKRTIDGLAEPQVVVGDDIAAGSFFGGSIALEGGIMVVGAPSSNGLNGVAYVFLYNGSAWVQLDKLISSDGPGGAFGYSVAIDNMTILVGAPTNQAAYVFNPVGSDWVEDQKLTSPLADSFTFGRDVDLFGNTALIGAYGDEDGAGAAYIFTYAANTWTEQQQLTANDGAAGDAFGTSVALGNNLAVIGAPGQFGESNRAAIDFNNRITS